MSIRGIVTLPSLLDLKQIINFSTTDLLRCFNGIQLSDRHDQMLGDRLRSLRIKNKMSLHDLAERVLMSDPNCILPTKFQRHTIRRIEKGERKLSLLESFMIAKALGVDVYDLIPDEVRMLGISNSDSSICGWELLNHSGNMSCLRNERDGQTIFIHNETKGDLPRMLFVLASIIPYRTINLTSPPSTPR